MAVTAPKCKTCGVAEFSHVCNRSISKDHLRKIEAALKAPKPKKAKARK